MSIFCIICIGIAFIGFKIGISYESKHNLNQDTETIIKEIHGNFESVDYLLQRWTKSIDESNDTVNNEVAYNQLIIEVGELKSTLSLSDKILLNDGYSVPFHTLNNSIEIAFSVIEGVELNEITISNNFFDDKSINESEAKYINTLYQDVGKMVTTLRNSYDQDNDTIDLETFKDSVDLFISKYAIGDELLDLIVDN